jgi:hypothetical protein
VLEVLPQFRNDAKSRHALAQRDSFDRFVAEQYAAWTARVRRGVVAVRSL